MDIGSGMVKAGFAGEDLPRVVFPNIVGRLTNSTAMQNDWQVSIYIGEEALHKQGILNLSYPV
jgi:actin